MSKGYLCIGTWHRLCMFLFLVHMLFADTHQGQQTTHFPLSQDKRGHPPFKKKKKRKKKKLTWIYILKGHCQVRSIKCFFFFFCVFPIRWRPSASNNCFQFLMPFCLDTPVCALSLHETFPLEVLQAGEVNTIWNFEFYITFHLFIYIYLYIFTYIYLVYICVCKYSYIKDFCLESLLWRYGGDVLLFSSVSGTSLGGTAMAERRASLLLP